MIAIQCIQSLKSFHRRKHEKNTVFFSEFLVYDVGKIRISIFSRDYSHAWNKYFARVWIDTCFHFHFHNICDLLELIENRKYCISAETVRMERFALVEL
jgi:hypothetical protein